MVENKLKYSFEPFKLELFKDKSPISFLFNFSTYDHCAQSFGIFLLISINAFGKRLSICIKPIGKLQVK